MNKGGFALEVVAQRRAECCVFYAYTPLRCISNEFRHASFASRTHAMLRLLRLAFCDCIVVSCPMGGGEI